MDMLPIESCGVRSFWSNIQMSISVGCSSDGLLWKNYMWVKYAQELTAGSSNSRSAKRTSDASWHSLDLLDRTRGTMFHKRPLFSGFQRPRTARPGLFSRARLRALDGGFRDFMICLFYFLYLWWFFIHWLLFVQVSLFQSTNPGVWYAQPILLAAVWAEPSDSFAACVACTADGVVMQALFAGWRGWCHDALLGRHADKSRTVTCD